MSYCFTGIFRIVRFYTMVATMHCNLAVVCCKHIVAITGWHLESDTDVQRFVERAVRKLKLDKLLTNLHFFHVVNDDCFRSKVLGCCGGRCD